MYMAPICADAQFPLKQIEVNQRLEIEIHIYKI